MRKISFVPLFIFFFTAVQLHAQNPDWAWANSPTCAGRDYPVDLYAYSDGNTLVTGTFTGSITFGTTTLTSAGNADAYLVKYDKDGNVVWAKNWGGTNNETGRTIGVDATGNLYFGGIFNSNSMDIGTTTLTSGGWTRDAIFLAKLDANGDPLWAVQSSGTGAQGDAPQALLVDGSDVYMSGSFVSSALLFESTTLTNQGDHDIWMTKYDNNGALQWAKSWGGSDYEMGYRMAKDASGNFYLTGGFRSSTLNIGATSLNNAGGTDIFVMKVDAAGSELGAAAISSSGNEDGTDILADGSGVYVSTRFDGTLNVGAAPPVTNGGYDIGLIKFDNALNPVWATNFGGTADDEGHGLAQAPGGGVYLSGHFASSPLSMGTYTLNFNGGVCDLFLAWLDAAGTVLWAESAGSTSGYDRAYYLAADAAGNAYLAAWFNGPSLAFGTHTVNNTGDYDTYLAKLTGGAVSAADELAKASAMAFPNPAGDAFSIAFRGNAPAEWTIKVYDLHGTLRLQQAISGGRAAHLRRSGLESGLYIYRIETPAGHMATGRIRFE